MQKFILGLAVGVAIGTVAMAYSKSVRELAGAGKEFANEKMKDTASDVKEEIQDKTKAIKQKTQEVKKPVAKKATAKSQGANQSQSEKSTASSKQR